MLIISLKETIGDFLEHYFTNNPNLRSEFRSISYENKGHVFTFLSDLGVFSKDHIDFGSKLLGETILEKEKRRSLEILDVGCGYGFLGIILGSLLQSEVTLIDINKRAVHLAEKNILANQVMGKALLSNQYENVSGQFDMIVTNPPIRAGKKVVFEILKGAKEYLKPEGVLWFVMRKDQGAKSMISLLKDVYEIEIMEKAKGFYVMMAKIH